MVSRETFNESFQAENTFLSYVTDVPTVFRCSSTLNSPSSWSTLVTYLQKTMLDLNTSLLCCDNKTCIIERVKLWHERRTVQLRSCFFLTQTNCFDYSAHRLVEVDVYILIRLSVLNCIFRHVRKIVKSHYYLRHVFPSVRPSVRMQISAPTGRIFMKFYFEHFSKIYLENSRLFKIGQE
jgi:hypothetical protein